ncbi:winged helix-turn-helix domain-containing protein [Salegentibacter sp. Hel_I_6]|uniref:winged helix-turn-helix domain-containing protein n=1 Tax=Salegentibacter sp. Hel_I_6 TaxID=1250278 RepID=UPI00056CFA7F|nr:winged helix-turn-helix domain-containing protein [Salegentibacter sp. Hel_I_6]
MAITTHDEIRVPALQLLTTHDVLKLKDFVEPLGKHFKLTEEEIAIMYPSGNGHIFHDRILWALSYLNTSSLFNKPRRGKYSISSQGIQILKNFAFFMVFDK